MNDRKPDGPCLRCAIVAAIRDAHPGDFDLDALIHIAQTLADVCGETLAMMPASDRVIGIFQRNVALEAARYRALAEAGETGGVH